MFDGLLIYALQNGRQRCLRCMSVIGRYLFHEAIVMVLDTCIVLFKRKTLSRCRDTCTVGSYAHEPHESRSIKIWSATFSKILQASELLGTNAIQFYMEKEAFDQILESGTASPSLSLWGHLNSLIEAAGQFFLYWVIIQPVLVVCTLFQSHITTRSEIKAKIRFCIYTICHITIELTVHGCTHTSCRLSTMMELYRYTQN